MSGSPDIEEICSKDEFKPISASTPVKGLGSSRCVDLYDSESDEGDLETPAKKRPQMDSCWLDMSETSWTESSACRAETCVVETKTHQNREPVWVSIDDSTSTDPLQQGKLLIMFKPSHLIRKSKLQIIVYYSQ